MSSFPFERLLSIKKKKEETEGLKLREMRQHLDAERLQLEKLQRSKYVTLDGIRRTSSTAIDTTQILQRYRFLEQIERKIIAQHSNMNSVTEQVNSQQDKLLVASKEKKIFEKLRARKRFADLQVSKRNAQKRLDEIAIRGKTNYVDLRDSE